MVQFVLDLQHVMGFLVGRIEVVQDAVVHCLYFGVISDRVDLVFVGPVYDLEELLLAFEGADSELDEMIFDGFPFLLFFLGHIPREISQVHRSSLDTSSWQILEMHVVHRYEAPRCFLHKPPPKFDPLSSSQT